jgi:hypothetical protein
MSNCLIAILAEDDTDCDTLRKIVHRVLGKATKTKKWSTGGCSKLRRKLNANLTTLSQAGCNAFIVVHDLDRNPQNNALNDEAKLRQTLESSAAKAPGTHKHISKKSRLGFGPIQMWCCMLAKEKARLRKILIYWRSPKRH